MFEKFKSFSTKEIIMGVIMLPIALWLWPFTLLVIGILISIYGFKNKSIEHSLSGIALAIFIGIFFMWTISTNTKYKENIEKLTTEYDTTIKELEDLKIENKAIKEELDKLTIDRDITEKGNSNYEYFKLEDTVSMGKWKFQIVDVGDDLTLLFESIGSSSLEVKELINLETGEELRPVMKYIHSDSAYPMKALYNNKKDLNHLKIEFESDEYSFKGILDLTK